MSYDLKQFRTLVTETLMELGYNSKASVALLLGTAAVESNFGTFITQINGPALGVFQMEPNTLTDIWSNYLIYRPKLVKVINDINNVKGVSLRALKTNLLYQITMARIHYLRQPEPLPKENDIKGLASYWKKYYNTYKGKGSIDHFIKRYNYYVLGGSA